MYGDGTIKEVKGLYSHLFYMKLGHFSFCPGQMGSGVFKTGSWPDRGHIFLVNTSYWDKKTHAYIFLFMEL